MEKYIAITLFIVSAYTSVCQEKKFKSILKADISWGREYFEVPTGFARDMTLKGFEEAIFLPGWIDNESPEFWSYVFAWSVKAEKPIAENEILKNLEIYFNGLVKVNVKDSITKRLPTMALLVTINAKNSSTNYKGKVRLYDRFKTKEMLTLNLLLEQFYCKDEEIATLIFRFSPAAYEKEVWKLLKSITVIKEHCKL